VLAPAPLPEALTIHDRGGLVRVPLADILYVKAECKYLTVRTAAQSYLYEGALNELEQTHPERWLRIHRNALVARHRVRALEKAGAHSGHDEPEGWWLRLDAVPEALAVSRRQLPLVRELLNGSRPQAAAAACGRDPLSSSRTSGNWRLDTASASGTASRRSHQPSGSSWPLCAPAFSSARTRCRATSALRWMRNQRSGWVCSSSFSAPS